MYRTYRIGVSDRPRLPRSRLPVRKHSGVESVEAAFYERESCPAVHLFLGRFHVKHVVESEFAVVAVSPHYRYLCVCLIRVSEERKTGREEGGGGGLLQLPEKGDAEKFKML